MENAGFMVCVLAAAWDWTKMKPQSLTCVHFVYDDNHAMQEWMAEGHNGGIHKGMYWLYYYVNLQILVLLQE
jgi:hypothetical protein